MTTQEELLELRALVQKQQMELDKQQAAIEAKDQLIEKQNIQIENMIQALLHARKKLFGPSTEVTKDMDGRSILKR